MVVNKSILLLLSRFVPAFFVPVYLEAAPQKFEIFLLRYAII